MSEYQYYLQTPDGEMHLVDADTDEQAKAKLCIFLNFTVKPEDIMIFDKMELGEN